MNLRLGRDLVLRFPAIWAGLLAATAASCSTELADPGGSLGNQSQATSVSCPDIAPPDEASCCHACSGASCQANGCFGGYWCNASTCRCLSPATACDPAGGTVGPNGGSVDRLAFAVFGDVRPRRPDQDSTYPTATFGAIAERANATAAEFALGTGDYMFSTTSTSVGNQLASLLSAEQSFTKPIFHSMGNHECKGFTNSNCPNGTESPNVRAFLMQLTPFTEHPYYSFTLQTQLGSAKFVFVAPNAWNTTQQSWLEEQLTQPSDYTFVIRHEPPGNTQAPGAAPSDAIIAQHPLTLGLYGHTHEYRRVATNQLIVGNGGAPLSSGTFGFVYVVQRLDGNLQVQSIRSDTGQLVDSFALTPAGAAVP